MTPRELLIAGKEAISDPIHWTKGADAKNQKGEPVEPWMPEAVCFCAYGAMAKVLGTTGSQLDAAINVLEVAHQELHPNFRDWSPAFFNDYSFTTHTQVMAMFDRAIEKASS